MSGNALLNGTMTSQANAMPLAVRRAVALVTANTRAASVCVMRRSRVGAFLGGKFGLDGVRGNRRSSEATSSEPNKRGSIGGKMDEYNSIPGCLDHGALIL